MTSPLSRPLSRMARRVFFSSGVRFVKCFLLTENVEEILII